MYADHLDNAWTGQGDQVHITSSLMLKLDRRSDFHVLAAAAHEIAHLRSNHSLAKAGMARAGEEKSLKMEERQSELSTDEAVAALSRQQELEADALAVQYLAKLGYTKDDYLDFLKWMGRNLEDPPPSSLATHPTTRERMEHIQKLNPSSD